MARQVHTVREVIGPYEAVVSANEADIPFVAAIVADKEQVPLDGKIIVLVRNVDATNPYTVTFTSVADEFGRTGDITTYSLAAGEVAAFEFEPRGWKQADGNLYFEAANVKIEFAVLRK